MDDVEGWRQLGRPRRHRSSGARAAAAYLRRAAGAGLVRVSVLVPAGKAANIRAIAGAMRQTSRALRKSAPLPQIAPAHAKRSWTPGDDDSLKRSWRNGATGHELTSGLGRPCYLKFPLGP
jgi:hypothetical protein